MIVKSQGRRLRKLVDEEWKEIPNSNGMYFISNYGRVKSFMLDKTKGQILKLHLLQGYYAVTINALSGSKYVHRMVAETWLKQPSPLHTFVIHLDGNKRNNHVSNLAWATLEEVNARSSELMRNKSRNTDKKKLITRAKLKEEDVKIIKSMLQRGITQNVIAKLFKISEMQVTRIKRGENWNHIKVNEETN
ncbi:MAG: NUMOD4 motif-containing HNH endonuclease [Bacteroidales bacterium]|nr:NUMOD4 motif-containing HNH endonuclease [Bacteroidales bacterium]